MNLCQSCGHAATDHERPKPEDGGGKLYGRCLVWFARLGVNERCPCPRFVPPSAVVEKITGHGTIAEHTEHIRELRKQIADARRDINTARDLGNKAQRALIKAKTELEEIEARLKT